MVRDMTSSVTSPSVSSSGAALLVEPRSTENRGQVRRLRKTGFIPANVYGGGVCEKISVPVVPFMKEMAVRGLYTRVFTLQKIGRVIIREIQFPAVKDVPLHIDFMRLIDGARIVLSVPLRLIHEELSPGIKRGGVANLIHYTLQLSVLTQSIPSEICVDVSSLDIGKTLHLRDLVLPEGTKVLSLTPDEAIVGVVPPAGLVEELRGEEGAKEEEGKGK